MRQSRGASDVARTLDGLLGAMEQGGRIRESLALAYWDHVVGTQAAAASEAESVRDGVLIVRTKSSVWSHELTFLKSHIIAELNRRLGRPAIREILFRAQGVKRPAEVDEPREPTDEDLASIVLPAAELAELRRGLEDLIAIPDDRIRESIARRMMTEARLRQWRLTHGWRPCACCAVPHQDEGDLCPICRLAQ